jgi:hypothetical protein
MRSNKLTPSLNVNLVTLLSIAPSKALLSVVFFVIMGIYYHSGRMCQGFLDMYFLFFYPCIHWGFWMFWGVRLPPLCEGAVVSGRAVELICIPLLAS